MCKMSKNLAETNDDSYCSEVMSQFAKQQGFVWQSINNNSVDSYTEWPKNSSYHLNLNHFSFNYVQLPFRKFCLFLHHF
jgi:hypothetical protein